MTNRSIMVLGAGVMQIPLIRKAKEMGLTVIATDANPAAPGFKHADHAVNLDIKDSAAHVAFAVTNRERFNISGVIAGADVAVTASSVSTALGLPGIPLDVAERSNKKSLMKQRWLADGIPTPYAEEVETLAEAKRAVRKVGLPCMVKAIDNAASRGSRRIDRLNELAGALEDAKVHSTTGTALIEEYVEGEEQSVELIAHNGVHYRFGIVDRYFDFKPYPIEVGHANPTALSSDMQSMLYSMVIGAAESLGIGFGPYKADTIITRKGPMLLELPARLSGGFHSQYTTPLATGLEPQKAAIALAAGLDLPVDFLTPGTRRVSLCRAVFPEPGLVTSIDGVKKASELEGVAEVFVTIDEGDVIEPYRNCAQRVCYIITVGGTHAEAERSWRRAAETIRIRTEAIDERMAAHG